MININLATKPGLQDETGSKPAPGNPNEIFAVIPPTTEASEPAIAQISSEIQESQPIAMPALDDDMFASIEANLEMMEQAEAEEFVPRHISLPPEKLEEEKKAEKIEELTKQPGRRRLKKVLIYGLIVIVIGGGSYWTYLKYFKTLTPTNSVSTDFEKPEVATEQAESVPVQPIPAPAEMQPLETVQPIYQSEINAVPSATPVPSTITQPQPSQVEDVYVSQILSGAIRCQTLAQVVGSLPVNHRLQYLKLKTDKVSFLVYVGSEEEAQRLKAGIQNLPGILSTEVFYIERMAGGAAPAVQIMAILKLRNHPSGIRSIRFQNDVALSQVLWSAGKRNGLNMQPLNIAEPPAPKPRLSEFRGNGSANGIANLLQELSATDLNLSIEQVSLSPGYDQAGNSAAIDFTINSIIYPQKM